MTAVDLVENVGSKRAPVMRPIGDFAVKSRGSVDPSRHQGEVFELFSIPAYDQGYPEVLRGAEIGSAKKVVGPGDVLISRIVPHIRRVWIVGPSSNGYRQIASGEWLVFGSNETDPNYLRHMLLSTRFHEQFMQTVAGIGGSLLRARPSEVARIEIPIPASKFEQIRIAAMLDKADAIRRKRKRALALADDLLRSVFLEMFGDPATNARDLPTTSVEAICDLITDCLHTTPNHFDEPNEYPSIRSSELQGGYIDLSSAKYVSEAEYKVRIQRYRPVAGDTIYCREGARFGNCGIIPEGMTPCLGQRTMLLRANLKVATPEYLWAVLCSKSIFEQAGNVVGGAASPHVNIKDIRKFKCLRPPLELQQQFSLMCQRVFAQRRRHFQQGEDAETLFSSLSQRAFRGEL